MKIAVSYLSSNDYKDSIKKIENLKDSEFTQTSVPASQKKSFWEICVVWIGYVFVVTGMQVGYCINLLFCYNRY